MWAHRLAFDGARVSLRAPTLATALGVCEDEPFARQPSAAYCSGAWVGADVVVTAAHCLGHTVEAARDRCRRTWLVRGFAELHDAIQLDPQAVFACTEVLGYDREADLAIVTLGRPVDDGSAPLRPSAARVSTGDAITVWSHGAGLPLKLDDHATVVDASPDRLTFTADSDTFEGSSGGFALDARGELAGLVLRGSADWKPDGPCQRALHADRPMEALLHGDVVARALQTLPARAPAPPPLCGDGRCAFEERGRCDADCDAYRNVPDTWLDDPASWPGDASVPNAGCALGPRARASAPWFVAVVAWVTARLRRRRSVQRAEDARPC
jgi:hypothetical protein